MGSAPSRRASLSTPRARAGGEPRNVPLDRHAQLVLIALGSLCERDRAAGSEREQATLDRVAAADEPAVERELRRPEGEQRRAAEQLQLASAARPARADAAAGEAVDRLPVGDAQCASAGLGRLDHGFRNDQRQVCQRLRVVAEGSPEGSSARRRDRGGSRRRASVRTQPRLFESPRARKYSTYQNVHMENVPSRRASPSVLSVLVAIDEPVGENRLRTASRVIAIVGSVGAMKRTSGMSRRCVEGRIRSKGARRHVASRPIRAPGSVEIPSRSRATVEGRGAPLRRERSPRSIATQHITFE